MTFQDNLLRYRRVASNAVGGVYGQRRAISLGHHPAPPALVFFDDGVHIRADNPSTKLYNPSSWVAAAQWFAADIVSGSPNTFSSENNIEFLLKLENPVDDIASISISTRTFLGEINFRLPFDGSPGATVMLAYNLILIPFTGSNKLEDMTYDTHGWRSRTSTHGTFYDTGSNFDDNPSGIPANAGYELRRMTYDMGTAGSWKAETGFPQNVLSFSTPSGPSPQGVRLAQSYNDVVGVRPKSVGPIFGIHVYFIGGISGDGSPSFGGAAVPTTPPEGATDMEYVMLPDSPRAVDTVGAGRSEIRSFVITGETI